MVGEPGINRVWCLRGSGDPFSTIIRRRGHELVLKAQLFGADFSRLVDHPLLSSMSGRLPIGSVFLEGRLNTAYFRSAYLYMDVHDFQRFYRFSGISSDCYGFSLIFMDLETWMPNDG